MATDATSRRSASRRRLICVRGRRNRDGGLSGLARAGSASPRAIDIVGAPSNLGLRPLRPGHIPGARRAPGVLRAHRVIDRLGARDRGDVVAPAYDPSLDAATGYRNGANLAAYTPHLADRIGASIDDGRFTLVLGGDCSVLLGGALALDAPRPLRLAVHRRPQRLLLPAQAAPAGAAGMDLALATGHGPDALVAIDGSEAVCPRGRHGRFAYRDFGTPDEVETERFSAQRSNAIRSKTCA